MQSEVDLKILSDIFTQIQWLEKLHIPDDPDVSDSLAR